MWSRNHLKNSTSSDCVSDEEWCLVVMENIQYRNSGIILLSPLSLKQKAM